MCLLNHAARPRRQLQIQVRTALLRLPAAPACSQARVRTWRQLWPSHSGVEKLPCLAVAVMCPACSVMRRAHLQLAWCRQWGHHHWGHQH
eukprot:s8047_g1.t1